MCFSLSLLSSPNMLWFTSLKSSYRSRSNYLASAPLISTGRSLSGFSFIMSSSIRKFIAFSISLFKATLLIEMPRFGYFIFSGTLLSSLNTGSLSLSGGGLVRKGDLD